jgi:glycosyltransferase involved in cell wall biosynthesis
MVFKVLALVLKNQYDLVHAVEESVFIALLLRPFFGLPYLYDMDSSLAQQMVEQIPRLAPVSFVFRAFEKTAVKHALAVVPVCDALAEGVEKYEPRKMVILHDVSLLDSGEHPQEPDSLKTQLRVDGLLMMYVGNLQPYQGIDLLLESFAIALKRTKKVDLVIIGGATEDIERYLVKSFRLGILNKVHFLGKRPLEHLATYLAEADILVSPRIKGQNTPMKIYSYLDSGKPLLATKLPTHTQVVDEGTAMLAEPTPIALAEGIVRLAERKRMRLELGESGRRLVEKKFSLPVFREKSNQLFDWLSNETLEY